MLEQTAGKKGLKINADKTKMMEFLDNEDGTNNYIGNIIFNIGINTNSLNFRKKMNSNI